MKPILLTGFFLIPLVAYPNFGFERSKVVFFIFFTSLLGLLWLIKFKIEWSVVKRAAAVFVLILLLTSLIGMDFQSSLLGREPYFQGGLVYAYLWFFSVIVSSVDIKFSRWALILSLSGLLVALTAINEWVSVNLFHQQIATYSGRVVSTFGQPNFFAGFLLLTLPFAYFLFRSPDRRLQLIGWGSGLVALIGIMVSFSRISIILALLLLILGLLDQLRIKLKLGFVLLIILTLGIFAAAKFSSGIVGDEMSEPFLNKNPDLTKKSVEKRAYIWPVAAQVVWQRPLLGYGLENINSAFSDYFRKNKHALFEENLKVSPVLISLKELNIDRSHNYFLDLLLFSGIFGLLGWLWLVGVLFRNLRHAYRGRTRNVLIVALITYLVWVQFQNQSIVHLFYFWLLVGLIDIKRSDVA